jgi:hypothetical protein
MFTFFSEMAKGGMLKSFLSVRLDFAERETQTLSYELFDEQRGWVFDAGSCLSKVNQLCSITSQDCVSEDDWNLLTQTSNR